MTRARLLLATLALLALGAPSGPAAGSAGNGTNAGEPATVCDLPHEPGHKEIAMLLWRGPTRVEAGFLAYVRDNDLPFNFTCLSAESDADNLPDMVAKAKAMAPDLVYSWGTSTTRATLGEYDKVDPAKHVTDIPVLFAMVSYPVESRIVPSFESSGRNATGATHTVPLEAQIRAIQAYRPIRRLGVLYNPLENNSVVNIRALKALAREQDFQVIDIPVEIDAQQRPDPSSLPRLVSELAAREPQFLYIGVDSFIGAHRDTVIGEALKHGIPSFTATELEILRGDAMIGLYTSYFNLGRYMGYLAERVLLDGEDPAAIPVSTLSRFTYALRLEVARELEIYPPLDVLSYATILDRRGDD
jgi:putative ABC transport system substrate-binding protein